MLATIEGVTILDKSDVIGTDVVNEIHARVDVTQGKFVMILVVEDIE